MCTVWVCAMYDTVHSPPYCTEALFLCTWFVYMHDSIPFWINPSILLRQILESIWNHSEWNLFLKICLVNIQKQIWCHHSLSFPDLIVILMCEFLSLALFTHIFMLFHFSFFYLGAFVCKAHAKSIVNFNVPEIHSLSSSHHSIVQLCAVYIFQL